MGAKERQPVKAEGNDRGYLGARSASLAPLLLRALHACVVHTQGVQAGQQGTGGRARGFAGPCPPAAPPAAAAARLPGPQNVLQARLPAQPACLVCCWSCSAAMPTPGTAPAGRRPSGCRRRRSQWPCAGRSRGASRRCWRPSAMPSARRGRSWAPPAGRGERGGDLARCWWRSTGCTPGTHHRGCAARRQGAAILGRGQAIATKKPLLRPCNGMPRVAATLFQSCRGCDRRPTCRCQPPRAAQARPAASRPPCSAASPSGTSAAITQLSAAALDGAGRARPAPATAARC